MNIKKPNVVFVLTDDQGYGDLACHGNTIINTPNIDKLHSESTRFTNFHVGPTCAPTRAGIMTGHYANSTGVWNTIGGRSLLRKNEWTLATAFKESGFRTGIFGKWHLGDMYPYRPNDRGFEKSIVHGGGGIGHTPDYWGNDYFDDTYIEDGEPKKFEGYCTDVFFDEACKFIEDSKDNQFFCFLPCNAPHNPWNVESKYSNPYQDHVEDGRARMYGMITNIDENIGKLRNKLEELNLSENTILIFMTDNGTNGGFTPDCNGFSIDGYNAGLRGMKNSEYDGGHRVPFFLHWQGGGINIGRDINTLTANVDIMPTLLELCDIQVPKERTFHGLSLKPLLLGQEKEKIEERIVVTDSQRVFYPIKWRKSCVMYKEWRLINGSELYDLSKDREQRVDISNDFDDLVSKLRSSYEEWWEKVSEQFDYTIPISIGPQKATITVHDVINMKAIKEYTKDLQEDIHGETNPDNETAYSQKLIRDGVQIGGYYEIYVEESGYYKVKLMRWPEEAPHPINSTIPEDKDIFFEREFVEPQHINFYSGSKKIGLVENCSLRISDCFCDKHITNDESKVEFEVFLEQGETTLEALFYGADGYKVTPYYTYIEKIDWLRS